jgi:hypothetical protein
MRAGDSWKSNSTDDWPSESTVSDTVNARRHECLAAAWGSQVNAALQSRDCHAIDFGVLMARRLREEVPLVASIPFLVGAAYKVGLAGIERQADDRFVIAFLWNRQRRTGTGKVRAGLWLADTIA